MRVLLNSIDPLDIDGGLSRSFTGSIVPRKVLQSLMPIPLSADAPSSLPGAKPRLGSSPGVREAS